MAVLHLYQGLTRLPLRLKITLKHPRPSPRQRDNYESERPTRTNEKKKYFLQKRKLQFLNTSSNAIRSSQIVSMMDQPLYVLYVQGLFKCVVKKLTNKTVQHLVSLTIESQPIF
jgi:hypothetical protein